MDLNLENKSVIISMDSLGVGSQIKSLLTKEGATVIINNNPDIIEHKPIAINTIINIKEANNSDSLDNLLLTLYNSNHLTNEFTVINVGTRSSLGIKRDSYKNVVLKFQNHKQNLDKLLHYKTITIVFPEDDSNNIQVSKLNEPLKNTISSRNEQIANAVAFIISEKSSLNNGQTIFIDKGLHLFQSENTNHSIN